jgi:dihydrofolate reductase
MRKLIAAMKLSVDGKCEGTAGFADWVEAWSEDYGLTDRIDACLLGARMYSGYEQYWSAMRGSPSAPLPMTGRLPAPAELEWSAFAQRTPHYVLSKSMASAQWPHTAFLRSIDQVVALKREPGKDIYLMGGAMLTASLIDAGQVDELHVISYPLLAGPGKVLFGQLEHRRQLQLLSFRDLGAGRFRMSYGLA